MSGIRELGVTSGYPSRGGGGRKELPKATITLELPAPSSGLRKRLENEHELLFEAAMGEWSTFIAPFQTSKANPNLLTIDTFLLETAQRSHRSRSQIAETNEAAILFMYGEQAKVYSFSLRLMDGGENLSGTTFDWLEKMEKFYERFSGQTIADYNMKFTLSYKHREYTGVWLNFDIQEESDFDRTAGVTFQMFVLDKRSSNYTINGN